MKIDYDSIERPVRELSRIMNQFSGITTIGSCGGHENPTDWQEPLGSWFVTFSVSPFTGGWKSLAQIASVESEFAIGEKVSAESKVTVSVHTIGVGSARRGDLFFSIQGKDVDADQVAELLRQVRTGQLKPIVERI